MKLAILLPIIFIIAIAAEKDDQAEKELFENSQPAAEEEKLLNLFEKGQIEKEELSSFEKGQIEKEELSSFEKGQAEKEELCLFGKGQAEKEELSLFGKGQAEKEELSLFENGQAEEKELDSFETCQAETDSIEIIKQWFRNIIPGKRAVERNSSLRILLVGESGTGKSTLINSLFREQVVTVKTKYESETKNTTQHNRKIGKFHIVVFDTPDDDMMEDIKKKTQGDIDVLLFCIKMTDIRLGFDQIEVLRRVNSLGESVWEKGIFVMTFANHIKNSTIPEDEKLDIYFQSTLENWKAHLKRTMVEEVGIPSEVAENIPVVPAGHTKKWLPDREDWISDLWVQMFEKLGCPKMMALISSATYTLEEKNYNKFYIVCAVCTLFVATLVIWVCIKPCGRNKHGHQNEHHVQDKGYVHGCVYGCFQILLLLFLIFQITLDIAIIADIFVQQQETANFEDPEMVIKSLLSFFQCGTVFP